MGAAAPERGDGSLRGHWPSLQASPAALEAAALIAAPPLERLLSQPHRDRALQLLDLSNIEVRLLEHRSLSCLLPGRALRIARDVIRGTWARGRSGVH